MYCNKCGKTNPDTAKYCYYCGTTLEAVQAQQENIQQKNTYVRKSHVNDEENWVPKENNTASTKTASKQMYVAQPISAEQRTIAKPPVFVEQPAAIKQPEPVKTPVFAEQSAAIKQFEPVKPVKPPVYAEQSNENTYEYIPDDDTPDDNEWGECDQFEKTGIIDRIKEKSQDKAFIKVVAVVVALTIITIFCFVKVLT